MASGDGKRRSRAAGRSASATKKTQGIDPQSVREKVTKLVGGRACHMVKAAAAEEEQDADETSTTRVLFERLGLPEEPMVGSEGIKSNTAEFGSWVSDAVE
jgi:hypothetical protein